MSYLQEHWFHPGIGSDNLDLSARAAAGVAQRNELIVDVEYWSHVRTCLAQLNLTGPEPVEDYGLVRVHLPPPFADAKTQAAFFALLELPADRQVLGRNRLVAHNVMAFDDDAATSTPKVLPSSTDHAVVAAGRTLPAPCVGTGPRPAGNGVRIGLVDTAFTPHPYVEGSCLYHPAQLSELLSGGVEGTVTGHATFITSLIKRLAPGASVQVETVISAEGLGDLVTVHDAICRLVESGVDVINLSLGCVTADNEIPFALDHALRWAQRTDDPPIFVASAGNFGDQEGLADKPFWPAADPRVWAVAGATGAGSSWALATYSGHGQWVDAAAPTDGLLGARPSLTTGRADWDAYAYWSGTSFSAAVITGLIASQLPEVGRKRLQPELNDTLELPDSLEVSGPNGTLPLYGSKDVILQP